MAFVLLVAWQPGTIWGATEQEERLERSAEVLRQILAAPDKGIPKDLLAKSECLGIIPSVKKFAFGFGGRYGAGYVLCKKAGGKGPWGPPSAFSISGGSVGFQVGFSATDFVLLFMNHAGVEKLLQDKFTLGADASVAGGPVGRTASAATDAQLTAQILSYARSKGLFAGLALEGAVLKPSSGDNEKLYGKKVAAKDLLLVGALAPPAAAEPLLRLLSGQPAPPSAPPAAAAASAPQGFGTISGTVRDTTGAMIPDAVITIRNTETGASRTVGADAEGRYTASSLPPGTYEMKAEAAGLAPVTSQPLTLAAGREETMHFTLQAGP